MSNCVLVMCQGPHCHVTLPYNMTYSQRAGFSGTKVLDPYQKAVHFESWSGHQLRSSVTFFNLPQTIINILPRLNYDFLLQNFLKSSLIRQNCYTIRHTDSDYNTPQRYIAVYFKILKRQATNIMGHSEIEDDMRDNCT